ncbi:hypothetical protein MXB_1015 [Myxobolus squamalis]|nr:hypothetical protein MXB_1015 [Myxobolus squamalis]
MPEHAQVCTLISISFQDSVRVNLEKNSPYLILLGIPNLKGFGSWGNGVGLN